MLYFLFVKKIDFYILKKHPSNIKYIIFIYYINKIWKIIQIYFKVSELYKKIEVDLNIFQSFSNHLRCFEISWTHICYQIIVLA